MHSKLESLQRQLQDLKAQQHQSEPEADFKLVDISAEPWPQVLAFLESRRLGSSGLALYEALRLRHALRDDQQDLLEKLCIKLGHSDWPEAILKEIASFNIALELCNKECSRIIHIDNYLS